MAVDWDKILRLTAKTGDKYVVNDGRESFVVMRFADYEQLINNLPENLRELSEDELIARINEDIADWRLNQTTDEAEFDLPGAEDRGAIKSETEDDEYYLEPVD
jgi:hypothetical protein